MTSKSNALRAALTLLPYPGAPPPPDELPDDEPVRLPRGLVLRCFGEGDAGDGRLFATIFRGRLLYDQRANAWHEFSGHRWHRLSSAPQHCVWGSTASAYLMLAAELRAEQERATKEERVELEQLEKGLIERAGKLRSLGKINNVLAIAQNRTLLGINAGTDNPDPWDADPWLLCVANGVLDLRTGELRNGRPEDMIRTQAPTTWEGLHTPAPRWERFVSEVMSAEADRVAFLQRLLGYSINGTTREHVLGLLVGQRGRNGKRVLMETIQHVLGDYAATVSTDVVIGQDRWRTAGAAQPHLMDLQGRRLAVCSETSEGAQLSAATVKNITGGDLIRARRLHENPTTFAPTHTLFLQTNRKPQAPADDDALWERVKVIEFKVRFVDEPTEPDERPRDHTLEPALLAETPGILAWLVRGHLLWYRDGLQTPDSVRVARDTYRLGESLQPFLDECCAEDDRGSAEGGELFAAYEAWCKSRGLRPKTQAWFGRQLAQRFEKGRTATGRSCYYGLTLVFRAEDLVSSNQNPSEGIRTP